MSTTHCGTNIVRIRVDLFNDILRFDYVLQIFFFFFKHIILCDLILPISVDWEREREKEKKKKNKQKKRKKKEKLKIKKMKNRLGRVE